VCVCVVLCVCGVACGVCVDAELVVPSQCGSLEQVGRCGGREKAGMKVECSARWPPGGRTGMVVWAPWRGVLCPTRQACANARQVCACPKWCVHMACPAIPQESPQLLVRCWACKPVSLLPAAGRGVGSHQRVCAACQCTDPCLREDCLRRRGRQAGPGRVRQAR